MKKILSGATVLVALSIICMGAAGGGCDDGTDAQVQQKQEAIQSQESAQVGMPGVTDFTEAKLVRRLYEMRDKKVLTYSYIADMNGKLWHLCDSIGYGLPYGVQFSNPEKRVNNSNGAYNLPQAEPNGLFMPPTAEGTWVTCINPQAKGDISPVYVESRVIVSPFKLNATGDYAVR